MWLLVFCFMWVNTADQGARLISAYYPYLLATPFLGREWPSLFRRSLAGAVAALALSGTILCLIFSTNYPLYVVLPANDQRGTFEKMQEADIGHVIPASERNIGIIRCWNEWETFAWKPYGSRRVYELPDRPDPADLARKRITYVIITQQFLAKQEESIETWTASNHAVVASSLLATAGTDTVWGYYVTKLDGAVGAKP
jgi:hypothetical protein